MSTFVEFQQDGRTAFVNSDNILLVLPSTLINQTDLLLTNGLTVTVSGSANDFVKKSQGKDASIY